MENSKKRVYCCGVFDLCHIGHMELIRKISHYGSVIVGVHNDDDVISYKRKPYMTMEDRAKAMNYIKGVDEVILNAPLITTIDFMQKHKIDLIAIPEEYADGNGGYYDEILKVGCYVLIDRYNGISTTDIIERIRIRNQDSDLRKST